MMLNNVTNSSLENYNRFSIISFRSSDHSFEILLLEMLDEIITFKSTGFSCVKVRALVCQAAYFCVLKATFSFLYA